MNRILKYGLLGAGAVAGIAVAVVAYVAITFNPNDYKPQIIQAVKDSRQRTLRLDGDIKLSFFPSIGANLSRMSLSEHKSEKEFAAIESVRVSLALMPLLRKQVSVSEVAVSGLTVTLVRHKDGTSNIDDLLAKGDKDAKPQAVPGAPPVQFDIAAVSLDKTDVIYRDEAAGAQYELKNIDLKTGRIARGVPSKVDFSASIAADRPKVEMTARMKATLTFDLERNFYEVSGLDFQAQGEAQDISNLAMRISADASANMERREFSAKKLLVSVSGFKGKDRFEAKLDTPSLNLSGAIYSSDKVLLETTLEGALGNIAASLVLSGIEGNAQSFRSSMNLEVDAKQPEQAFKAKLSSPVSVSFETRQFNLDNLKLAVHATGGKLPGKSVGSELKGSVRLDAGKQSVQANLSGVLLQSKVAAKLAVNGFTTPAIRFDVDVDQLDLDQYLPKSPPGDSKKTVAPEVPFDLSALKNLDAEGGLRIGSFKVMNVKLAQLRLDMKAYQGQVTVNPLSANLYQGSMSGSISVNAQAVPVFTINEKLNGVAIAPMIKDLMDIDVLEGASNVTLNLATQGNTVSSLKRGLRGDAALSLSSGAIRGINLPRLIQNAQSLGKGTTTQTLGINKGEKTEFSEFRAGFKVSNGIAHNDDLSVVSTSLRITGSGDIDIGNDSLNYSAKAVLQTSQHERLLVPVQLSGPYTDMKYRLDYTAMLADLARQKIEARADQLKNKAVDDAKARLQDELRKGLKGLFK